MTDRGAEGAARPAAAARAVGGLLAGLLGLDVVMNAAALEPGSGAAGILRSIAGPSIDLLVVVAALMGVSRGEPRTRRWPRVLVAGLGVMLLVLRAGTRFAWAAPGGAPGWALGAALALACGAALYALSAPVIRGLALPLVRSVTLLAIALAAVVQVLFARVVFTPSVVPDILREIGALR